MRAVIRKLQAGDDLGPPEVALVESFVVGDAEAYTRVENDFANWINELTLTRESKAMLAEILER